MLTEAERFFEQRNKMVVTFAGFSGAGYEDPQQVLNIAQRELAEHCPENVIVNIGATSSGIGAVYELAKKMGFETTGIVSSLAKNSAAEVSPYVDSVFYVNDKSWGGFERDSTELTPTSRLMVQCSDIIICIGGGAVARDEMIAAQRGGKITKYVAADMNHNKAIERAHRDGLPIPSHFKGEAFAIFGQQGT